MTVSHLNYAFVPAEIEQFEIFVLALKCIPGEFSWKKLSYNISQFLILLSCNL